MYSGLCPLTSWPIADKGLAEPPGLSRTTPLECPTGWGMGLLALSGWLCGCLALADNR